MPDFPLAEGRKVVGDYAVYPNSLLFRAGTYPDKDLEMSAADIAAAASAFVPVEFNVEHAKHGAHEALAGAFGGILKTWVDPKDPEVLRGEIGLPLWLDERLATKAPSLEFTRANKQICGAALTYTPRVAEAMFSAAVAEFAYTSSFAMTRHNTPDGQMTMQSIHDTAARAGAVCDRKNAAEMSQIAEMSSQHEATGFQKIHDESVKHGADCASGDAPAWAKSMFSAIHSPATPTDPASGKSHKGETMFDKLKALFSKAGVPDADIDAHLIEAVAEFSAPAGMTDAEKAQFSSTVAELARLKADGVQKDAKAFALGLVQSGQAAPHEASDIIATFCQAAADDAALPSTVNFSAVEDGKPVTKQGSRLDALKARESCRPSSGLTRELFTNSRALTQDDFTVSFSRQSQSETPEEKAARIDKQADEELAKHGKAAKFSVK